MATAEMKVTVVLNSGGQVTGASKHVVSDEAKGAEVTSGLAAGLGQMLVEIEVPAHVGALEGGELLAHLAEHASVKAAIESSPATQTAPSAAQSEEAFSGTF